MHFVLDPPTKGKRNEKCVQCIEKNKMCSEGNEKLKDWLKIGRSMIGQIISFNSPYFSLCTCGSQT